MKKTLSVIMVLVLLLLSACGANAPSTQETSSTTAETQGEEIASQEPEKTAEAAEPVEAVIDPSEAEITLVDDVDNSMLPESYPSICEDGSITLTLLQETNSMVADFVMDYNELQIFQELQNLTGIQLEWLLCSGSAMETQFNLLVAAEDLPDVCCVAQYYTAGIASAVENDVFMDLAELLPDYAPNYYAIVNVDGIRQQAYNELGQIIAFYEIGQKELTPNIGMLLRGDWLDEQGLPLPVTYDQYESTLLQLKNAYQLEAPLVHAAPSNAQAITDSELYLSAGKEVREGFSLDKNGSLIYGPIQDAYREYLQIMNRWYEEGLIYHDFYTVDAGNAMALPMEYMSNEKSACMFTYCEFVDMIKFGNESAYLTPGYLPRETEDQAVHLTQGIDARFKSETAWAVSCNATEDKAKAACMLINYLYTEEGALLANWGVEDVSFTYQEDGTPWYTELVLNNADGLTQTQAEVMYLGYKVPTYSDYTKYNIAGMTKFADWIEIWGTADNAYALPALTLTIQETETYTAAASDVETYLAETLTKFIIGDLDIDDNDMWNSYLENLFQLGLQDMIDCYQAAMDRYRAS